MRAIILLVIGIASIIALAQDNQQDQQQMDTSQLQEPTSDASYDSSMAAETADNDKSDSHISNGAMSRNNVNCSKRGGAQQEANCQPAAVANPYNRGCPKAARCRTAAGTDPTKEGGQRRRSADPYLYWNRKDGDIGYR